MGHTQKMRRSREETCRAEHVCTGTVHRSQARRYTGTSSIFVSKTLVFTAFLHQGFPHPLNSMQGVVDSSTQVCFVYRASLPRLLMIHLHRPLQRHLLLLRICCVGQKKYNIYTVLLSFYSAVMYTIKYHLIFFHSALAAKT